MPKNYMTTNIPANSEHTARAFRHALLVRLFVFGRTLFLIKKLYFFIPKGVYSLIVSRGAPAFMAGVLNVIHGGREAVDFICDSPDIKAISFVGGNQVGRF